jgi:hypothetical protein
MNLILPRKLSPFLPKPAVTVALAMVRRLAAVASTFRFSAPIQPLILNQSPKPSKAEGSTQSTQAKVWC